MQQNQHTDYNMKTFINMDKFISMMDNSTVWWVEYNEDGIDIKQYFNTEEDAISFYNLIKVVIT